MRNKPNKGDKTFAAIDIGSNTFRLMVAEKATPAHPTPWHILAYTHRIVRLGEGLHDNGRLCDAAMQRAMQAFSDFSEILQTYQIPPEKCYATATAAMREAENGNDFCQQVRNQTGIDIQVITGEKEANTSLLGSCAVLPHNIRQNMLLFDIGGGSTEFIRAIDSKADDAISRKLGVVRLVEAHLRSDPPSQNDYQAIKDTCHQHLQAVETHWQQTSGQQTPPPYLVGTAGTVTTLAAIDLAMPCDAYDANIINNHCISKQRFMKIRQQLCSMKLAQRQNIPAIEAARADLMVAGMAIIETIFERWQHDKLYIVDAGLLEGAWLTISQAS